MNTGWSVVVKKRTLALGVNCLRLHQENHIAVIVIIITIISYSQNYPSGLFYLPQSEHFSLHVQVESNSITLSRHILAATLVVHYLTRILHSFLFLSSFKYYNF